MSNKKLQVFVSSTFEDLKEERQAAVEAILSAGHIPAGMELFTAGDETQMTVIKRWIDESDVYLLILGGRYGSVDKVSGKSYTQLEYEYAVETGKALFAVVIYPATLDRWLKDYGYSKIEKYNTKQLEDFRQEVSSGKVVKFWDDAKDIKLAIYQTLSEFSYRKELVGWVRGDNAVSGNVAEELARLGKENEQLRDELNKSDKYTFYAGLSFIQLKELLINTRSVDGLSSLFEDVLTHGRILSLGYRDDIHLSISKNILSELEIYGVLTRIVNPIFTQYKFTEDGHNFYLKALALQNQENKS